VTRRRSSHDRRSIRSAWNRRPSLIRLLQEAVHLCATLSVQGDAMMDERRADLNLARECCDKLKAISPKLRATMQKGMQRGFSREGQG
jgi:hypothetical protein